MLTFLNGAHPKQKLLDGVLQSQANALYYDELISQIERQSTHIQAGAALSAGVAGGLSAVGAATGDAGWGIVGAVLAGAATVLSGIMAAAKPSENLKNFSLLRGRYLVHEQAFSKLRELVNQTELEKTLSFEWDRLEQTEQIQRNLEGGPNKALLDRCYADAMKQTLGFSDAQTRDFRLYKGGAAPALPVGN